MLSFTMDKFLLSSPALPHMEIDQSSVQRSLYETAGLGAGFLADPDLELDLTLQVHDSPPSLAAGLFDHSRNLSFIQEQPQQQQNNQHNQHNHNQHNQHNHNQHNHNQHNHNQHNHNQHNQHNQQQNQQQHHQQQQQLYQQQQLQQNHYHSHSQSSLQAQASQFDVQLNPSLETAALQQQVTQQYQQLANQYTPANVKLGAFPQQQQQQQQQQAQQQAQQLTINTSKTVRHSVSANTISSTDSSIPQLSSSFSTQSLLDSPTSLYFNTNTNNTTNNTGNTPQRKPNRKKSLSFSSANLYNTPLRGSMPSAGVPFSPTTNTAATGAGAGAAANGLVQPKVGKTPHSSRGHSRSRSRLSLDAINTPFLMNTAMNSAAAFAASNAANTSNSNVNNTNSFGQQLTVNGNPFYTPSSFESPKLDEISGDLENLDTPLATPHGSFVNLQSHKFLSPAVTAKTWNATSQSTNTASQYQYNNPTNPNEGYITPLALQRNDTLDSIKIEDQDDDALKEIRKAKNQYLSRMPSNFANSASNSASNSAGKLNNDGDSLFLNTSDIHIQQHQQIQNQHQHQQGLNLMSSHSTPGVLNSRNSPPQSFNSSTNILTNSQSSFSVPPSASANFNGNAQADILFMPPMLLPLYIDTSMGFSSQNNHNMTKINGSITNTNPNGFGDIFDSQGIETVDGNVDMQAPTLLPPMATFTTKSKKKVTSIGVKNQSDVNGILKTDTIEEDKADPKKKHACPLCLARFQRPEHVKRHMKSHSSEKPYECDEPECNKRFNRKDNLKAHLKKIHGRLETISDKEKKEREKKEKEKIERER